MKEFVDKERKLSKEFEKIEALVSEGKIAEAKELLRAFIKRDPYFLKSYILLSDIYELEGSFDRAKEFIEEAYKRAMELIAPDGNLPDRLEWRHPTNRHIIEALINAGVFYWELGEIEKAIKVLRQVFSMNPSDEPGVRFYLLALLEGMSFDEFEQVFSRDGEYDYEDLHHWFEQHAKNHPEEFKVSR